MHMLDTLWLPILVSAVFVFIASSLIHMVFKYHASDRRQLSNEDAVRAAIRAGNPAPGMYALPYCADMKQMGSPEMQQKMNEGPVGSLVLMRNGSWAMGPTMGTWFLFNLVISCIVGVLAYHTLLPGAVHRQVFHVVGLAGLLAYAGGQIPGAIWFGKPWSVALKDVLDGLIYGVVMAAAFAWLWPAS